MRLPGASSNAKGAALRRGPGGARGVAYFLPMLQRASGPGCRRRRCCCRARCGCPGGSGRPCRASVGGAVGPERQLRSGLTLKFTLALAVQYDPMRPAPTNASSAGSCVARSFGAGRGRSGRGGVGPGPSVSTPASAGCRKSVKRYFPEIPGCQGGGSRPATRIVRDPRTPRNAHRSSVGRGSIE